VTKMKHQGMLSLLLVTYGSALVSQYTLAASSLDQPWSDPNSALVLDPYHGNSINWEKLKTDSRVMAIIHKATTGTSVVDPAYFERKLEARQRGYLWGSYHWGVAGHPREQADFYLDRVQPGTDELIALDLEDVSAPKLMNASDALLFIKRIHERTGRYPLIYGPHSTAQIITNSFRDSEFAKTRLWYARYKSHVNDFPAGVWTSYTLWQFSSEVLVQIHIAGTQPDMDVSVFNGSAEKLRSEWPLD
jgi:lysozyme